MSTEINRLIQQNVIHRLFSKREFLLSAISNLTTSLRLTALILFELSITTKTDSGGTGMGELALLR